MAEQQPDVCGYENQNREENWKEKKERNREHWFEFMEMHISVAVSCADSIVRWLQSIHFY